MYTLAKFVITPDDARAKEKSLSTSSFAAGSSSRECSAVPSVPSSVCSSGILLLRKDLLNAQTERCNYWRLSFQRSGQGFSEK